LGDSVSTAAPSAPAESASGASPSDAVVDTTPVVADDPEYEIDQGVKLKRSELRELHTKRKELDRGAYEKMQAAAKERKEAAALKADAQSILDSLGKDYKAALRKAGHDPIKIAEQILTEALAEHSLSPAEKEARALREENERYKAEQAQREEQEKQAKANAEVTRWEQALDRKFSSAIQATGLPKTARVVARMAEKAEAYWSSGVEASVEDIAAEVKSDLIAERREMIQSAKDDHERESFFDDSELEIARKAALRRAQGTPQKPQSAPKASAPSKPKNGLTRAELEARINKRIGA
jgi:hypothetical protein